MMPPSRPPAAGEKRLASCLRMILAPGPLLLASLPALASPGSETAAETLDRLPRVIVSAAASPDDPGQVPASIDVLSVDASRSAQPGLGLSELLGQVPGVTARNRQNYAQDEQISIRGYGARATFGVRGVRVYSDDIPGSMPDGSGQVSHFSIDAADRLEVLRGPFSALYGNSSGGVIALYSAPGGPETLWRGTLHAGSNDFWRAAISGRGQAGAMGYNLVLSRFSTDGWREHSQAQRDAGNVRLDWQFDGSRQLTLIANAIDMPDVQDPLGLTWEQVQSDPRQTTAVAEQYNTRKSIRQSQGGAIYRQELAEGHSLRLLGYGGTRDVTQYLAIPISAQNSPTHSGGAIDLATDYHGGDVRWQFDGQWAGRPVAMTAGLSADRQSQTRRGYENHLDGILGVEGRLRRDEDNRVAGSDQYVQVDWRFADRWSLLAGARHSRIAFRSDDRYITATNPDDSGRVTYSDTTPVTGLMFHAGSGLRLYASHGRGFETPTFAELSYRADGGAGLAFNLKPAQSRNHEVGAKWRPNADFSLEAALFRADTDDELAVARNSGGRSSYQNVAGARRQGMELALDARLSEALSARLAYTRVEATFRSAFLTCTGTPCVTPATPVAAGSPIPGVPRSQIHARLGWEQADWRAALDLSRLGTTVVNDTATQTAPASTLLGLEASREFGPLRLFARIDNLADRDWIGSVIVNDGNGRYFEPGPGRTWNLGAQWTF